MSLAPLESHPLAAPVIQLTNAMRSSTVASARLVSSRISFRFATANARNSCRSIQQQHLSTTTTTGTTTTTTSRPNHQLNCGSALVKASEGSYFTNLIHESCTALQGIGPVHAAELKQVGIQTVQDLANYKFFHLAKAIQVLSTAEETGQEDANTGGRLPDANMNLDKGLDKAYESKSFADLLQAPVDALQGISQEKAEKVWKPLGVQTVQDLANCKYFQWAEAMVAAAKFEDTK